MQIHNLTRPKNQSRSKIVGRGGKRGTTSGRGTKGQKARAGHSIRPDSRDLIKALPKKRGYRVSAWHRLSKPMVVNLAILEKVWPVGEIVSLKTLAAKSLINRTKSQNKEVKILGTGNLTKKLKVVGCTVSKTAAEKIKAAGGTVEA